MVKAKIEWFEWNLKKRLNLNLEEAGSNLKAEVTMVVEVRQAGGLVRLVVATSGGQGTPLMELFASHPSLHRIDCSPVRERQWGKFA